MTAIFFAYSMSGEARHTFEQMMLDPRAPELNLLVSFYYLKQWNEQGSKRIRPARTILDSGAFSAWKSKAAIDLNALIAETKDPRWHESVALDVIGDAEASMQNALAMQAQGSPAYPVFHIGDPWEMLTEYKQRFPKVGLSCRFGEPEKESLRWLEQCFARAWPYRFHSFGWVSESMLLRFPFHTADTASWNNGPSCYGRWRAFGQMSVRGVKDLRAEIEVYLQMQTLLQHRWNKELSRWPTLSTSDASATPPPISSISSRGKAGRSPSASSAASSRVTAPSPGSPTSRRSRSRTSPRARSSKRSR